MINYKTTKIKTDKPKWLIYILIGLGLLFYILKYSDWHFILKFLISIPLVVNLLFDISYFKKAGYGITQLNFDATEIEIIDKKENKKRIPYSNFKYSIRKRKFDRLKTEIELKIKKNLRFKTFGRLHITSWENIFEIENELENRNVISTEWKPQTIWRKYWGIFIDLFFLNMGDGDIGMEDYQERLKNDTNENRIKK
ncbi:hypothetical protein EV196_107199 [Mariniflexile fucanivorans]|uniref:Uncharacterized protein n=1 Tax=Mariniflexile fucanivorans TaxID=264023 RepID=A0A4R1REY5_9FLAO|nr:hypothetical protein [Mariniflexile fucanivorans]TCL64491.1 hypothetical protein EV196_107199 [Mariniflexile fucanivorans]